MSEGESADSSDSQNSHRSIADYSGAEYDGRGVDAHLGVSAEAGDGANPASGEYGVYTDQYTYEHAPDRPSATRVGGPSERTSDRHDRLKETNDARDRLIDDEPMSEVEKERIVHGFAGLFELSPRQRGDALAAVREFDFSTAGSSTIEQVALAAIQVVVNHDRFERLDIDPNDDTAWISRSDEFTAAMDAADMDGSTLNRLSSKIQQERVSLAQRYNDECDRQSQ